MSGLSGIQGNVPQDHRRAQQPQSEDDFSVGQAEGAAASSSSRAEVRNPAYVLSLSKEARELLRRQRQELK